MEAILPELRGGVSREALRAVDALGGPRPELLRMAVLFLHGMGPGRDPREVAALLARLRFSNAEAQRIGAAVRGGPAPPPGLADDPPARRRWTAATTRHGVGVLDDVFRVWQAVSRGATGREPPAELERAIASVRRDVDAGVPTSVAQLAVGGRDLVANGWRPGPGIGAALRDLLEAVWEDPALNDRETLLARAAAMTQGEGTR